ncbi:MAG TPA: biopolymer transporter ExbD [Bacteroidales bacterium]|nr:biopolymer transporter ExbD [Bacteroidales bacterium]
MAEVQTGGGEQKKGKPKKMSLRVDFTPMVDMNMLLITFFMFCTSLAKPQTMDITMPVKDEKVSDTERNKVADDKAITIILGEDNKIYYFFGKPNYQDYNSLKVATYGSSEDKNSLRSILLGRNKIAVANIRKLRDLRDRKQLKLADYAEQVKKIKNDKNGQVVIIKPTDKSTYKNLVDALDEMQICSIGIYAIVDVETKDQWMIDNLKQAGALTAASDFGKAK